MNAVILDNVLEEIRDALIREDLSRAVSIIESLRPADQAEVFSELDDEDQVQLLPQLDPDDSADILEEMDEEEAAELVSAMSPESIATIVDAMEPDEAADLLGDIHPDQAENVLTRMESPEEVRPLMKYADDTAGGLMTTEFLMLRNNMTPHEAIQAIRRWQTEERETFYYYISDAGCRLCGVVNLHQIITASPAQKLEELMNPDVIHVHTNTDQEECARLMRRYDLITLPVVDDGGVLVGIITIDDVMDVVEAEATEDIHRMGGALPLSRSYLDTGVFAVFRKRIGWLLLLFITETLTGSVLRLYERELEAVVALAFFVPLLIGTGGNAGSQTTSTIIRALALGDIEWKDALRSLWHELRIGLILGLSMSVVACLRAMTWGSSIPLSLTVSLAILAIIVWANALGAILPLLANKLKIDPTVVSGPVMSTLVDATGLLIYFNIARLILRL